MDQQPDNELDVADPAEQVVRAMRKLYPTRFHDCDAGKMAAHLRPVMDAIITDAFIQQAKNAAPHHNARNDPEDPASAEFWKARVGEYAVALGELQKAKEAEEEDFYERQREEAAILAAVIHYFGGEVRMSSELIDKARKGAMSYRADANGVTLSLRFADEGKDNGTA
jgi:hypothetical protein